MVPFCIFGDDMAMLSSDLGTIQASTHLGRDERRQFASKKHPKIFVNNFHAKIFRKSLHIISTRRGQSEAKVFWQAIGSGGSRAVYTVHMETIKCEIK